MMQTNNDFKKGVYNFRTTKSFHFHGLKPSEEIEIIVSAAAVQVSWFEKLSSFIFYINIYLSDVYQALNVRELFIGHVSPTGIYISWKYFGQGYYDYSVGMHGALHQMAHAFHQENFIQETGIDWDFRQDFNKLRSMYGPLMSNAIVKRRGYLRGYAFTNFHEFWAVSIE